MNTAIVEREWRRFRLRKKSISAGCSVSSVRDRRTTMNEYDLKRLEHGRKLRESTTLIKGRAIVDYDDGSNRQWELAGIPPGAINTDGYVEEVWIAPGTMSIAEEEVNGEVHLLLSPGWLTNLNLARVYGFEVFEFEQEPSLIPSPNLVVRYRIDKQLLS